MKYLSLFNPSIYIVAAIIKHGQNLNMSKKLPQQSNIKTGFHDERAQYKKVFFSEKESHL